ncbi:MAG TPA: DUF977 family protein [Negativicutes bacterium]|nr:DUF977 family protein [Negativicutes bacterium]
MASLPELSPQIIEFTRENGRITIGDAIKLTGTSRNTLKVHFRNLVERRHLTRHGSERGVWHESGLFQEADFKERHFKLFSIGLLNILTDLMVRHHNPVREIHQGVKSMINKERPTTQFSPSSGNTNFNFSGIPEDHC